MNRVVIASIAVLSSFTVLHSGRTDSYGGHHDNSTGEYHYHHGYSAHYHYDINGDGIADCPYVIKDNTSNKSDESKHESYSDWIKAERGISESETNSTKESSVKTKKKMSEETFENVVIIVFVLIILFEFVIELIKKYRHRK